MALLHDDRPRAETAPASSPTLWQTRSGRVLAGTVLALLVATLAGLAILWPSGSSAPADGAAGAATVSAEVVRTQAPPCPGPGGQRCLRLTALVADGEDAGREVSLTVGPVELAPDVSAGDDVRLSRVETPPGARAGDPYAFAGMDRRAPLLVLAIAVAIAAVLLVSWRGVLALAGLAVSLLLVTEFLLPALLAGEPALAVALVGAMAVTFVTVTLTSGLGAQTMAAMVGIAATLLLAAGLATIAAEAAHLDGRSTELASALAQSEPGLSLQGVVVAGVVLGALGALTDTAVTQASAVMALRRADPLMGFGRLYREAFAVGRDHLSATVHTLVLAYAGATLPLLLALEAGGVPGADALSSQELAEPVAATLVGALGLLACVPLTTGLAALLAVRVPAGALPAGHAHVH